MYFFILILEIFEKFLLLIVFLKNFLVYCYYVEYCDDVCDVKMLFWLKILKMLLLSFVVFDFGFGLFV